MTIIRWSDDALDDLRAIHKWIDADSSNAAANRCDLILDAVDQLQQFNYSAPRTRTPVTRRLQVANTPYVIFYQPLEGAIDIMRIRHGAQDLPPGYRLR